MTVASQIRTYLNALTEAECIPLPQRMLRVSGAALDFYQLLKMLANPNLAHKVTYAPTVSTKTGVNPTDITMVFNDDISYEEAKSVFRYYGITFTDSIESNQINSKRYVSKNNPPDDGDRLHGQ